MACLLLHYLLVCICMYVREDNKRKTNGLWGTKSDDHKVREKLTSTQPTRDEPQSAVDPYASDSSVSTSRGDTRLS